MFAKVQFLKDTSQGDCGKILPDTFLIYRDGYSLPELSNVEYLEFQDFKNQYFNLHTNKLIFVGLNRMITPSNRCDMVFDYMATMTRNIEKISIDTQPFIGEPWRVWWHYDMTNQDKFNLPHSYAMETEWKQWFYKDVNDCRLSAKNLTQYIAPNVSYSDLEQYTTTISFYDVKEDENWYQEAKDYILKAYHTPKMIVNNLLKVCNKRYELNISYDSFRSNEPLSLPDNKLYRIVGEEIQRRLDIYNTIIQL